MSLAGQIKNAILDSYRGFQGITYGEVLSYDADTHTCDVQLLKFTRSEGDTGIDLIDYPKALDIPIALPGGSDTSIKTKFTKGDIVAIAFSASKIDTTGKKTGDLNSFMSKANAVIVGSLGSTASSPAIDITDTEIVFTVGTTKFTIDASGATVSVAGITVNLFTHLHGGPGTPPTPNT